MVIIDILKKIEKVEPGLRSILTDILKEIEKYREYQENTVTKTEFKELKDIVKEIVVIQKNTESRVNELAEAQKRTEEEIRKLSIGLRDVRKKVGGLSRSVAYFLENEAYRYLPKYLAKNCGLKVINKIIRTEIDGREINFLSEAEKDDKKVYIVGESVLRLDDRNKLKKLWERVELVKEIKGGK